MNTSLVVLSLAVTSLALASVAGATGAQPTLAWGDCATPTLQSRGFACGVLRVPQNWNAPDAIDVTLPFAIRRAKTSHRDSVAFLIGGPGGTNIGFSPLIAPSFDTIDRDIVFLERRGAAFSRPALGCPPDLSRENLKDLEAIRRCASELRARHVDLDAYGTDSAARDLEALRQLLKVEQWDLFGASYGTLHALTVMRDFAQSVRVSVLDSPLPPDADPFSEQTSHQLNSLAAVFEACRQEPACNAKFPMLREKLLKTIASLEEQPLEVMGQRLDGQSFLQYSVDSLESSYMARRLPLAVSAAATRDTELLTAIVTPPAASESANSFVSAEKARIALGLWLSVECSERAAFARSPREDACTGWPGAICTRLGMQLQDLRKACEVWPVKAVAAGARQPVSSEIPTLIFTGEFDPITPTAWGERAARTLKHSRVLVMPGGGHTVAQEPCPMSIIRQLYESGSIEGDRRCLNVPRPPFLTHVD